MSYHVNPAVRRRVLLLVGLVFTVWASWQVSQDDSSAASAETSIAVASKPRLALANPRANNKPAVAAAPVLTLDWPTRVTPEKSIADPFNQPPKQVAVPKALPTPAIVPVMALKYVGRLEGLGPKQVFLADAQDRMITAAAGQTVGEGWLLFTLDEKQLVFRHTATGHEQTMLIGAFQ